MAECVLVLIGATPEGKKGLLGFQVGCVHEFWVLPHLPCCRCGVMRHGGRVHGGE